MITVIIDNVSDWERLRERLKIGKEETFFTFLGEDEDNFGRANEGSNVKGLSWFIKENIRYAVRSSKPIYPESIRAKVHDG